MLYIFNDTLTFQFKEIYPDFSKFNQNNYYLINPSSSRLETFYNILFRRYNNSWVRYETIDDFKADFCERFENVYNKYDRIFTEMLATYSLSREELLLDRSFQRDENQESNSSQTNTSKMALTPIIQEPSTEFDDNFTNQRASGKSDQLQNFDNKISEKSHRAPISEMKHLVNMNKLEVDRFCSEFADLFIQIVPQEEINFFEYIKETEELNNE